MFLHFSESACPKRIRQIKIWCQFCFLFFFRFASFSWFHNWILVSSNRQIFIPAQERKNVTVFGTWKQNTSLNSYFSPFSNLPYYYVLSYTSVLTIERHNCSVICGTFQLLADQNRDNLRLRLCILVEIQLLFFPKFCSQTNSTDMLCFSF